MAIPLLLLQREGVSPDAIGALRDSTRAQIFHEHDLASSATAFSARTARATIVATARDPLEELVFVRTSGFVGPLVLAIQSKFARFCEQARDAGLLGCLILPITPQQLEPLLNAVEALPLPPLSYPRLGLFLDAIDHTARHGESAVRLSQREFALLHCLVRNGTRPVPVGDIHDYVWGGQREGDGMREIVDVNISQLRKKLSGIGLRGAIRTYRDFGYGLTDELIHE
jgi:Transcriptional regulatory protein, C terminal